ncbi:MAG: Panacea domain-containing protein [Desulfocucumaceae bacterium]|nr:SocA family protein [candidate division TA06 bacterium]
MTMLFREDKATQTAARFLELGGGKMDIIKLVKLIYLAEREAIVRWGSPIIYDNYCSMRLGPVPSLTLNLINGTYDIVQPKYWQTYIAEREGHAIRLKKRKTPNDQLSRAEESLISEIYGKYGKMDKWKLSKYTHKLPEWKDPDGSSLPISISDILTSEGYNKDDINEIKNSIAAQAAAKALLG